MKSYPLILIFLLSFFISSCTDTLTDIGKGTLSYSDSIIVKGDTFHISSSTLPVKSIISQPDSFLLGTFYDSKFGTIKAEILAQLNCPVGFRFPANYVTDSAVIYMSYYSCFGDTLSPINVNIYEMDKATFSYTGVYSSDTLASYFSNRSVNNSLGEQLIVAKKNSSTSKIVRFKLNDSFINRFIDDKHYSSTTDFTNFFKGLYITTNFGTSTLLNIGRQQLNLVYFYHYIHGNETIKSYITFPASKEVRQVNCIQYPDRSNVVAPKDSVTYLSSPANLCTELNLPLDRIKSRLSAGVKDKNLTINSAILHVNVTATEVDTTLHPVVKYVLLIKDKDNGKTPDNFFKNRELPSDTCSILGRYTVAQVGTTGNLERYYSFDIAKLIANELRQTAGKASSIKLRLIPVAVGTSTSTSGTTSITSVKQQYLMNAVTLRSGKEIDPKSGNTVTAPMTLKMIYSGF